MDEKGRNDALSDARAVIGSHSRVSVVIFALICLAAFIIAVSIVVSAVLLCFSVSVIEVDGDSRYTYSEILAGAGIEEGNRLYFLNVDKAQTGVLGACPYLSAAEVEVCFPNRIIIHIREHSEIFAVAATGGIAYLDPTFRVIDVCEEAPAYEYFDAIFIGLSETVDAKVGDVLSGEQIERAIAVLSALEGRSFYEEINIIDVSDQYEGFVIADKRLKFGFGSMADLDDKIGHCEEVVLSTEIPDGMAFIFTSFDGSFAFTRTVDEQILRDEFYFCKN